MAQPTANPTVRHRVRIRFAKTGELRFIGHRDLARTWERMIRRAGLPLAMSLGFRPKPRMNFPSALSVGISGEDEVMELDLHEPLAAADVQSLLEQHSVPGLTIKSVEALSRTAKARVQSVTFEIAVPEERQAELAQRAAELADRANAVIDRGAGHKPLQMADSLESICLLQGRLQFRLRVRGEGTVRPREVLAALGADDLEFLGVTLARTAVELEP